MQDTRTRLLIPALLGLVAWSVLGCGGPRSTRVLAFFFDGVPAPGDTTTNVITAAEMARIRAQRQELKSAKAKAAAYQILQTMHPPYAAQECDSCHNFSTGRGALSGGLPVLDFGEEGERDILVMPVAELCVECHDDKTAAAAEAAGLMIHSPVEEGECLECHNPHRSPYPHLLLAEKVRTLCFQCHDESIAAGEDDHPELAETDSCVECHNPHLSSEEFLLK